MCPDHAKHLNDDIDDLEDIGIGTYGEMPLNPISQPLCDGLKLWVNVDAFGGPKAKWSDAAKDFFNQKHPDLIRITMQISNGTELEKNRVMFTNIKPDYQLIDT